MDSNKAELLKKAVSLHGKIEPTRTRNSLEECFTTEDSKLILWFNDETGTTKVLVKEDAPQI
ncbi:MAG: hypothetical protein JSV89_06430 [Spirochaetaceae bacterium]|nr:MAG: hypothetical protein JSV89_06430 [Spirochaetaceae bacterium]